MLRLLRIVYTYCVCVYEAYGVVDGGGICKLGLISIVVALIPRSVCHAWGWLDWDNTGTSLEGITAVFVSTFLTVVPKAP